MGLAKLDVVEATGSEKAKAEWLFNSMRKGDQGRHHSLQKNTALRYHKLSVVASNRPCSLLDIPLFEDVLDVSIVFFCSSY